MDEESSSDGGCETIIREESEDIPVSEHCQLMTEGLFEQILPQMRILHGKLNEVDKSQKVMIDALQQENEKISQWNPNKEIETFMEEVKHYHRKLVGIKKTMIVLSERCNKMKKRAEKVKIRKEKQDQKEQEKRRKLEEKERKLIAKNASPTPHNHT